MQCLKSKYIQMRLRHKNPPFSLYISHLLLSFFKKLIYCPTNICIMKFEDQILNEPILLISRTCFCLVMDQEMVRRILPKKETETVDLF